MSNSIKIVADEIVFIANLDGGVWGAGVGEVYEPALRYGSFETDSFETILASPVRQRLIAESEARIAAHCETCPYFGHCSGSYVSEATASEIAALERSGCPVRKVIDHMVDTLRRTDLVETMTSRGASRIENPAVGLAL